MAKHVEEDARIRAIGNKIRELRKSMGYRSYETFAYDFELPRMQYWRMEKGTNCTLKNLLKILDIHNVTLEYFFQDITPRE